MYNYRYNEHSVHKSNLTHPKYGLLNKTNKLAPGKLAIVLDKIVKQKTSKHVQGTGLGLSLSYDIIKAHSGGIRVETKEGEFAKFIIEMS